MKIFTNVQEMKEATLRAGQLVETKGYYEAGDGGGGRYLIKDTATVDGYIDHALAGGTFAVLQYEGALNVKQAGAKGDAATDDTDAIQAALAHSSDVLVTSVCRLDSSLTVDMSRNNLIGTGNSCFDFTHATVVKCILFTATKAPPYDNSTCGIFGLEIKGDRDTQTALEIDNTDGASGTALSHFSIQRCSIHSFNIGVTFKKDAYLVKFNNCNIYNCNTCIVAPAGFSNYGENISFTSCTLFNSTAIADLACSTSDFFFNNCSFDYSTYIFKNLTRARVVCTSCHFEYTHAVEHSFCDLKSNATLTISDSTIQGTVDSSTSLRFGYVDGDSTCAITNTFFHSVVAAPEFLLDVDGKCIVGGNYFLPIDLTGKGLSNKNFFSSECCYISNDTTAITSVYTGANIKLTPGTNGSISVEKTYGGGSGCAFVCYIPANGAERMLFSIELGGGSITGSGWLSMYIFDQLSFNNEGLPRMAGEKLQGSISIDLSTPHTYHEYIAISPAATGGYFALSFNLGNVVGPGTETIMVKAYGI